MKWYKANTSDHQGLIVDEETGANIAVSYDKKNADLIASSPELLEACEEALDQLESWQELMKEESEPTFTMRRLQEVINKAKGQ